MRKQRLLAGTGSLFLLLLVSISSFAQNKNITGKVTDSKDGSPLPGVSIVPKGSGKGTTTAIDGSFHLTVNGNATTLVISSIGFGTKQVPITGSSLDIALTATNNTLN